MTTPRFDAEQWYFGSVNYQEYACEKGVELAMQEYEFLAQEEAAVMDSQLPIQEDYRRSGGGACPFCAQGNIDGRNFGVDDGLAWHAVTCLDCKSQWTNYYRLAGYVRDEGQPGAQEDWEAFLATTILETISH